MSCSITKRIYLQYFFKNIKGVNSSKSKHKMFKFRMQKYWVTIKVFHYLTSVEFQVVSVLLANKYNDPKLCTSWPFRGHNSKCSTFPKGHPAVLTSLGDQIYIFEIKVARKDHTSSVCRFWDITKKLDHNVFSKL